MDSLWVEHFINQEMPDLLLVELNLVVKRSWIHGLEIKEVFCSASPESSCNLSPNQRTKDISCTSAHSTVTDIRNVATSRKPVGVNHHRPARGKHRPPLGPSWTASSKRTTSSQRRHEHTPAVNRPFIVLWTCCSLPPRSPRVEADKEHQRQDQFQRLMLAHSGRTPSCANTLPRQKALGVDDAREDALRLVTGHTPMASDAKAGACQHDLFSSTDGHLPDWPKSEPALCFILEPQRLFFSSL